MKPSVFGRPSRRHVTWADRQRSKECRRRQIRHELLESRQLLAGDYPSVTGVEINGGDAQRSTLESLRVQFDRPVEFEGGDVASAFEVRSLVDGGRVGVEATSVGDGGATDVTLTFTGGTGFVADAGGGSVGGALIGGGYELIVDAGSVRDTSGRSLDGNGDGIGGDSFTFDAGGSDRFASLFGDATGDGRVQFNDFLTFSRSYNSVLGDDDYRSSMDADRNGRINFADFLTLANKYNTAIGYGSIDDVVLEDPLSGGATVTFATSSSNGFDITGFDTDVAVHRIDGIAVDIGDVVEVFGGTRCTFAGRCRSAALRSLGPCR